MNQLTALEAGFLEAEDSDGHVSLAIGGLAILEGPVPDHQSLISTLGPRILACPRFAQRLRSHLFDFAAPEWVADSAFDVAQHMRRISVPAPGGEQELFDLIAQVMSWRLDRSRPLWELWIIEGLSDNRWAMLIKVHHCIADGVAMAHMFAGLSDDGLGDSFAGRARTPATPEFPALPPTAGTDPLGWVGEWWRTSAAVARTARDAAGLAAGLLRAAPSSLNGPMSSLRRYSAARVSLEDVREVCRVFDVTINDVALAALTESYRASLIRHGEQPRPDSLRTLVPVSMRRPDAADKVDNRVSLMLPYLPVDEDNPVRRLRSVHARLNKTKATGQPRAGNALISAADHIPFSLTAWAVRLLTRLPQHAVATLATNIPGPSRPLRILGCTVTGVMPIPPIAMQLRTGVAILSYADDLYFGILADFDAAHDVGELARGVERAVARLVARSKKPRPIRDHHGLSLVVSA
ncbi:putative diacyglycerol O-acyltransferase tgs1 [Mycolicibacterium cyprinidarum]|nr:putative diacyglycerol O-acyltransferase tgs1 [Mycolicibacterium sp. NGTWS1803]